MSNEAKFVRGTKGSRKGGRGTVKNDARLSGLQSSNPVTGNADWGRARPEWVSAVVSAATLQGCIVSFQLSRDGGAHGLSLYLGGENVRLWFNGDADLDIELEKVFEYLQLL